MCQPLSESLLTINQNNLAWYLIYSKPRQERVAEENLRCQGYVTYLPFIEQRQRKQGRYCWALEPLFPRYLFIQLNAGKDDWGPIRSTRGVSSLVRFGGVPAKVPENLIDFTKQREIKRAAEEKDPFKPGERVRIASGVLSGYEGIFESTSGAERVTLLLNIVGKETRVELPMNLIESS